MRRSTVLLLALSLLLGVAATRAQDKPAAASATASLQLPPTDDGLPGQGPIRRYDWFRNLWNDRRAKWATRVEADQGAVVFLGDSITQGWGEDFSGWFPGLKIANRGISGDTSRGVLIRLKEDVLALNPKAVVLLIGTNDLEEKAEPETIAGNLKLILAELIRHNPKMPIVLCHVFPSSASKSRPSSKIKALNQLYADLVKGNAQVIPLETWVLFADAQGDAIAGQFPDLLHPNQAGYARWAAGLRPILATLGLMETTPYEFTPEPGFVSLFNGHDLTGWGFRVTPAADRESARKWQASDRNAPPWPMVDKAVSFDGQTNSPDGRYVALNGRLVVTTPPEGRRIQQIATTQDFPKDFILRLEFRATPYADSGIFIRGNQLQCRDYPLAGPYQKLKNYRPGDWNEIEVTVKKGVAYCLCNGEVLEAAMKVPKTGQIGLEGDRGQMEYRRIRIKLTP
ncbi:MAG TPA: GDSL-type esterase/lipase family protein [Candidatus Limnocylindria bacterium]|nr:GDSL-type esterase/lipase family protein [Candidatus Limnocylindria bacterium]